MANLAAPFKVSKIALGVRAGLLNMVYRRLVAERIAAQQRLAIAFPKLPYEQVNKGFAPP